MAPGRASSVVPMARRAQGVRTKPVTIKNAPMRMLSSMAVWTHSCTSSQRRAPKCWAMATTAPAASPVKMPTVRLTMTEVEPTAARATLPTNRPTTRVSTVL